MSSGKAQAIMLARPALRIVHKPESADKYALLKDAKPSVLVPLDY
jgi:hypothetical protein